MREAGSANEFTSMRRAPGTGSGDVMGGSGDRCHGDVEASCSVLVKGAAGELNVFGIL